MMIEGRINACTAVVHQVELEGRHGMASAAVARLASEYACTTNHTWTRDKAVQFLKRVATPEAQAILEQVGQ